MEAILFIGIQAAGKTSFYRERFFDTHLRLNMDTLKTRNREDILLRACLDAKMKFVVDNTNPTKEERSAYIQLARGAGFRVIGYAFRTTIEDALIRNAAREGKKKIPVAGVRGTRNKLEWPDHSEEFDELYSVKLEANGSFTAEVWKRDMMASTTEHLMNCGFRAVYGYPQSDEISLLFHRDEDSFGRKIRKYDSILSGEASACFSLLLGAHAAFDTRICQLRPEGFHISFEASRACRELPYHGQAKSLWYSNR